MSISESLVAAAAESVEASQQRLPQLRRELDQLDQRRADLEAQIAANPRSQTLGHVSDKNRK
jgi:hypothetical protein